MACHSLTSRLHSLHRQCAVNLAEGIIILKFLWKELCGDCLHAMRAATGDYSAVVMGCEMMVMILVASLACKAPSHRDTVCYNVDQPHCYAVLWVIRRCTCV